MPFIEVNNHKLHYFDTHPDEQPAAGLTFMFVHGLGSSQNYYLPVLPALSKHRCIVYDAYGSGRSQFTGQKISMETMVGDAVGLLDKLQVQKAVFVGHSMGGIAVMHLGVQHADRVLGLVAIGPTQPGEGLATSILKRKDTVTQVGMEPMANALPGQATGPKATPLQKAFIRELLLGQNPEGYAAICQGIAEAEPANYAAIKAPFLLIAGADDSVASIVGCEHIFKHVASSNKKMKVLAGVGHWHCIEASEHVANLIVEFVNNLSV